MPDSNQPWTFRLLPPLPSARQLGDASMGETNQGKTMKRVMLGMGLLTVPISWNFPAVGHHGSQRVSTHECMHDWHGDGRTCAR